MAKAVSRVFKGVIDDDSIFFQFDFYEGNRKGKVELSISKEFLNRRNFFDVLNENIERIENLSMEDMKHFDRKDGKIYLDESGNEIEYTYEYIEQ